MSTRRSLARTLSANGSGYNLYDNWSPQGLYSFLKVSPISTPVCRVIRDTDSAQQDFTESELLDGTLDTFANGDFARLHTWYDQSGNGFDITSRGIEYPRLTSNLGVANIDTNGMCYVTFANDIDERMWASNVNGGLDLDQCTFGALFQHGSVANVQCFGIGDDRGLKSISMTSQQYLRCNGQVVVSNIGASQFAGYQAQVCSWDRSASIRGSVWLKTSLVDYIVAREVNIAMAIPDSWGIPYPNNSNVSIRCFGFFAFTSFLETSANSIMTDFLLDNPLYTYTPAP